MLIRNIIQRIELNSKFYLTLLCILLMLAVPACVAQTKGKRLYQGEPLPVENIGFVRVDRGIAIEKIDGKEIKASTNDVLEFVPGEHTMVFTVKKKSYLTNKYLYSKKSIDFKMKVLAGNYYFLKVQKDPQSQAWTTVVHNVTHWPKVGFLFNDYLKQRAKTN